MKNTAIALLILIFSANAYTDEGYITTENVCLGYHLKSSIDNCKQNLVSIQQMDYRLYNLCFDSDDSVGTSNCILHLFNHEFNISEYEFCKENFNNFSEKENCMLNHSYWAQIKENERKRDKENAEKLLAKQKLEVKEKTSKKNDKSTQLENELKICNDKLIIYERNAIIDLNRATKTILQSTPHDENIQVVPK